MSKGGMNLVFLSDSEIRLFDFLRERSAKESEWPTTAEISGKLRISEGETKKLLNSLRKEGIEIYSVAQKVEKETITKHAISPETLEMTILKKGYQTNGDEMKHCALYLAEPAFGTKAFDDRYTMKGLALALEANGLAPNIKEVIIQGGVIPHIPPHYSKGYAHDLKFLGKVDRHGRPKTLSEQMLEDSIEDQYQLEFYEKHVNDPQRKKITDLTDAFLAAEDQIKTLMSSLPEDTLLRIQYGEEDRKNVEHLEVAQIQEMAGRKKETIEQMMNEEAETMLDISRDQLSLRVEKYILERAVSGKSLFKKVGEEKKEFTGRYKIFVNSQREEFDRLRENISESWDAPKSRKKDLEKFLVSEKTALEIEDLEGFDNAIKYLSRKKDVGKIRERIAKINEQLAVKDKEEVAVESRFVDFGTQLTWTKQLLHSARAGVTFFTSQYPVFADELEQGFKVAKDKYSSHFFRWTLSRHPVVHISPSKRVVSTGIKILGEPIDKAEIKFDVRKYGNKTMLLIHNIRNIFSDAVGPRSIKDAKLISNYENMVLRKFFAKEMDRIQPDIILLGGHSSGGFRVMPWFKGSEHLIDGKFVENQEVGYLINLPTLQSVLQLEWLVGKGFKNWHTKRYLSGPYSSAAIVHTEDKEEVNRFYVFDTSFLIEAGKSAEAIAVYREQLKDRGLGKKRRQEMFMLIKEEKERVRVNFKKIEVAGDYHLGAPDNPDRYSKDQMIKAAQIYQVRHGLPDIISLDEALHGVEERTFKSGTRYLGLMPEEFLRKYVSPVLTDSTIEGEEKAKRIVAQAMRNHRAITIHNFSLQERLFKLLVKPYMDKILQNGGRTIFISGNHTNKSLRVADEAISLGNMIDEKYFDSGQVEIFSGLGNDVGVKSTIADNLLLFGMHKFPEQHDEIYGVLDHMRRMNNDADIVVCGDRHQTGIGYSSTMVALHPGMETINQYVSQIGKRAGVRGIINLYYDSNKKGVYAAEFVINPTLEKIIREENII